MNYGILPEEFFKKPKRLQMFYVAAVLKAGEGGLGETRLCPFLKGR